MLLHTIIRSQCFLLWKPIIELGREMKGFASGANLVSAPPSGEYRKAMCICNLLKTDRNTIMWHPCSTGCEESDVECFCVWHKHVKPVQTKEWNAPANAFRLVSKAHGRAAGRCRCGWLSERWMSESFVLGRYLCRRLSSGGSELPVDQLATGRSFLIQRKKHRAIKAMGNSLDLIQNGWWVARLASRRTFESTTGARVHGQISLQPGNVNIGVRREETVSLWA